MNVRNLHIVLTVVLLNELRCDFARWTKIDCKGWTQKDSQWVLVDVGIPCWSLLLDW